MLLVSLAFLATGVHGQGAPGSGVGPFKTQTIDLRAGWNAIYLELEPLQAEPNVLFDGTPIEIAASYFRPVTSMEFFESPSQLLGDR